MCASDSATRSNLQGFVPAFDAVELEENQTRVLQLAGREIAVVRLGDEFFALDNVCPHLGGPLGEGFLKGTTLICPWHGWSFDVKTGTCLLNPAAQVETYPTRVENGLVLVALNPVREED